MLSDRRTQRDVSVGGGVRTFINIISEIILGMGGPLPGRKKMIKELLIFCNDDKKRAPSQYLTYAPKENYCLIVPKNK